MTYEAAKERLHGYIEHADQSKVMALYTLLNEEIETGVVYDEETVRELEQVRDAAISGKSKTYTLNESLERLNQFRKQHGV